jgi:large subunit ribosomal protein L15
MAQAKKKVADSADNTPPVLGNPETRLRLEDLRPAKGSRIKTLRVGRGRATGAGKTCNRGHNGEGQRSGRSRKRGFEGGQMPAYRQMPKINGFEVINRRYWLELNIGDLDGLFPADVTVISEDLLVEYGLLRLKHSGARLLGAGDVKRAFTIELSHVSASAAEKITAAGGTVSTR